MTEVIVISPVVFFHLSSFLNALSQRGLLLTVFLYVSVVLPVHAIDEIKIQIGSLEIEQQQFSSLDTNINLQADKARLATAFTFLDKRYESSISLESRRWSLRLSQAYTSQQFLKLISHWHPEYAHYDFNGNISVSTHLKGNYGSTPVDQINFHIQPEQITAEFEAESLALDAVQMNISGELRPKRNTWQGNISIDYPSGALLWRDWFIEPQQGALTLESSVVLSTDRVSVSDLQFTDPETFILKVPSGSIELSPLQNFHADVDFESLNMSKLYTSWLQPHLFGTVLEDAEVEGSGGAKLKIRNNHLEEVEFQFDDLSVADNAERLAIYNANINVVIKESLKKGAIGLSWEGAELYRVQIGSVQSAYKINQGHIALADTTSIPLYDGELKIFKLDVSGLQRLKPNIEFNGVLTPVSLSELTPALGLPLFSGSISGVIPSVHYDGDTLVLDGTLLAKAFDGSFRVRELRVNQLLSTTPRLNASFFLENLDLKMLTETFDFGRIEGRLSGHIANLDMVAWEPQSFDAFFYTPEEDESRHVISQRAVDNLTSLSGSDIGSVLSRSYLRFLRTFDTTGWVLVVGYVTVSV